MIALSFSMMVPNLVLAAVILACGTWLLVSLNRRERTPRSNSRIWIPLAALVAGPGMAFSLWAAALIFDGEMRTSMSDWWIMLRAMLVIGTFVGVVSSAVCAIALCLPSGARNRVNRSGN